MNGIEELINRYIFCNYQKIILRSFLNFEVSPFQKSLQFCFNFYIIILDPVTFLSIFKKKRYFSYFKLKIKKFEWNRRINESIHSLRLRNYSSIIPQLWSFVISKISSILFQFLNYYIGSCNFSFYILKTRHFSIYFKFKKKKFEWNRRINESIHSLRSRNYSSIIPQLWSFAVSKISSTRHIQS